MIIYALVICALIAVFTFHVRDTTAGNDGALTRVVCATSSLNACVRRDAVSIRCAATRGGRKPAFPSANIATVHGTSDAVVTVGISRAAAR